MDEFSNSNNNEFELEERDRTKVRRTYRNNRKINMFIWLLSGVLLVIFIFGVIDLIAIGTEAAGISYNHTKDKVINETYDQFFKKSFDAAENRFHVSNQASITINELKEKNQLEVLNASSVGYVVPRDEKKDILTEIKNNISGFIKDTPRVWLSVPANGIFTLNLQVGEFIVDNARKSVLVRVPRPELTKFTVVYKGVKQLNFEDNGIFKNSVSVGENLATRLIQQQEQFLREEMLSNQRFYRSAQESAKLLISTMIKQLNPDIPNLLVSVEFLD